MKKYTMIILALTASSCSELVHTQSKPPQLTVDKTEVAANDSDQIMLTATVHNQLSTQQTLRFFTTNGKLLKLPLSTSSEGNLNSVEVNPGVKEIKAVLRASLSPDENVIVSSSVGALVSSITVKFNRLCPDEVKVELNKTEINVNETIDFELLFLRADAKKVSQNTRVDIVANPVNTVEINSIVYSDSSGKATVKLKAIKQGSVTINFTALSGCGVPISPKSITIN